MLHQYLQKAHKKTNVIKYSEKTKLIGKQLSAIKTECDHAGSSERVGLCATGISASHQAGKRASFHTLLQNQNQLPIVFWWLAFVPFLTENHVSNVLKTSIKPNRTSRTQRDRWQNEKFDDVKNNRIHTELICFIYYLSMIVLKTYFCFSSDGTRWCNLQGNKPNKYLI